MGREVLRTRPEPEYEDYSPSHIGKGADYHDRFAKYPGRALMWTLEQSVIGEVLDRVAPSRVLDIACGTGRIAGFVSNRAPAISVTGIDISDSMLSVARREYPQVEFLHADLREDSDSIKPGSFDLVTAFRFFANADANLRQSVADRVTELVGTSGWLLFNNHRNFWSVPYIATRLIEGGIAGAINREVEKLFTVRGFRVIRRYSLGVWPQTETRTFLLPWSVCRAIEKFNLRAFSRLHTLGYNTVWLMHKDQPLHNNCNSSR
jgi:SAM-dependent methyltransferase